MVDTVAEPLVNVSTVRSYSERGATAYEDPMNKNFLYGDITVRFLKTVTYRPEDKVVLDIGCGTGFVFDEHFDQFKDGRRGIGVEPARGMLDIAIEKYKNDKQFSFAEGSFEHLPLPDRSVDRIVSTLALHWVKSLPPAVSEMRRVLRDTGGMDIFMIARDDGAKFKRAIVEALKKHLSFGQIMKTAGLVQRVTPKEIHAAFDPVFRGFAVEAAEHRDVVYGTFDDHMKWWTARSTPVIADVKDKARFMIDLREELEKTATPKGIPFDTAYLWIRVRGS
jgi:ubiquinone/menaquinone biosynthesis C-methylase UbiE